MGGKIITKYKCSNPKCKNKSKVDSPGFCPECGTKLKNESHAILFLLIGGGGLLIILILIGVILAIGSGNITTNHSNNISSDKPTNNVSTTTTPASNVFENKYYKFTTPSGTTVRDSNGNLAPAGGDNENLQLWDSSVNSKDIDGKEIGYAEINTGRMDGNAQSLIKMGYISSKIIAGYQSYYVLTPASGGQEAFGDYVIILGESKVQPGRTDTLTIEFDSDTADKINIVTDSLVIKSSAIK
jgi:hypothetical protein